MRSVLCALFIVLLAVADIAHGQSPCANGRCQRVVVGPLGRVSAPAGYRVERRRLGLFRVNVSPGR
jgi:hypothetical protein